MCIVNVLVVLRSSVGSFVCHCLSWQNLKNLNWHTMSIKSNFWRPPPTQKWGSIPRRIPTFQNRRGVFWAHFSPSSSDGWGYESPAYYDELIVFCPHSSCIVAVLAVLRSMIDAETVVYDCLHRRYLKNRKTKEERYMLGEWACSASGILALVSMKFSCGLYRQDMTISRSWIWIDETFS